MKKKYFIFLFALVASLSLAGGVKAATFELSLEKEITSPNDDVVVWVKVNSGDQNVNAAQAVITFPAGLLSVNNIDRKDSVFSFWLEEPTFSNEKGTVSFTGGSTSGFTGPSLKVMKIAFKVKGSGKGQLGITNGAITASDGSGSNVYVTAKGLDINIPTTAEFSSVKLERAAREADLAKILPAKPVADVSLYPDPEKWQNRSASFQARWELPRDVSQAGVLLDQKPSTNPTASAEALTGRKLFPALADGIWYLHLRFANNIGWGPTLHYRLAVDTVPPSSFKITSASGAKTNDPRPIINFASSDAVSGIKSYTIKLDNKTVAETASSTYQFAPVRPGVRQINVIAHDQAGNSTSETLKLEVTPITSPTMAYASRRLIVNEGNLSAGGATVPEGKIIGEVVNTSKQVFVEQVVNADKNGNWSLVINKALPIGDYYLVITAQDKNLAFSLPISSEKIKVRERPALAIGPLVIGARLFYTLIILLLAGAFGGGYWLERLLSRRRRQRIVIAQRDVINAFKTFQGDVGKLKKSLSNVKIEDPTKKAEIDFVLKKLDESDEKLVPYITQNIGDIE